MSEQVTIATETPAYQQMEQKLGAEGMAMLEDQLAHWNALNQKELASPLRDALKAGNTDLPAGTLLHGMGMYGFNPDAVKGVADKGIVSGELIGISEDSETHGCADFFRVPTDTTISDYLADARMPVTDGRIRRQKGERLLTRGIAFIVDAQAEGVDALLQNDGYRNEAMQAFMRLPSSRTAEDTAAILGGVPRGAIAGIIGDAKLLDQPEVRDLLAETFPDMPIFSHEAGQLQHAA